MCKEMAALTAKRIIGDNNGVLYKRKLEVMVKAARLDEIAVKHAASTKKYQAVKKEIRETIADPNDDSQEGYDRTPQSEAKLALKIDEYFGYQREIAELRKIFYYASKGAIKEYASKAEVEPLYMQIYLMTETPLNLDFRKSGSNDDCRQTAAQKELGVEYGISTGQYKVLIENGIYECKYSVGLGEFVSCLTPECKFSKIDKDFLDSLSVIK